MKVILTPTLENFIKEKVNSGLYANTDEVIHTALKLLKNTEEVRKQAIVKTKPKSLIETNPYLKDPIIREKLIRESVINSCGVEGVKVDFSKKINIPKRKRMNDEDIDN